MVNSCALVGGKISILDAQIPLHFGQMKVWDEDDRDDAQSFCLPCFFFCVCVCACVFVVFLQLHASLPRTYNWLFSLLSASCLGLRPPAAMTNG